MARRFEGKVAVVTGAAQGIGLTYARRLAAEGASVVLADILEDQGRAAADDIVAEGGDALFLPLDITDEQACLRMAEQAQTRFGRIDYLVNNAAIFAGMRIETLLKVEISYWKRMLDVNLTGALLTTRAVAPIIALNGGGAIVNQSSAAAYSIGASAGYYGISKLALNGLTHALASELGPLNIRVNSLAPGATETIALNEALTEPVRNAILASLSLKRMGSTDDQANALLFLLSDESSFITGQVLCVDGGRVKRA